MGDARRGETSHPAEMDTSPGDIRLMLVGARLFAEALAVSLQAHARINVIGVHSDPIVALDRIRQVEPDIVILDGTQPHSDLARLVGALRSARAKLRVVILALACEGETLAEYVRAGAAGCVTVHRPLSELVASLQQVHNGELLFDATDLLQLATRPPPTRTRAALAPREVEVLQVLATGKSTQEAAAELGISVHTLRTHLKKSMTKLDARSKLDAIMQALRAGIISLPR